MHPQGFEIQWKVLSGGVWKTKYLTFTSVHTLISVILQNVESIPGRYGPNVTIAGIVIG
jgi:hypothetical protein